MINHIISYIQFLKAEHGLSLTIHDKIGFLGGYMYRLVPYNIHSNPYCLYVKACKAVWDKCIARQEKVFQKCEEGIFFGTCYAGVNEYVVPVWHKGKLLAFISISGYKAPKSVAKQKIEYMAKEYCLNKAVLEETYGRYLEEKPPLKDFIETVITPLCCMLERLYLENQPVYSRRVNANADYIYGHILSYIAQNYAEKITLADISKACFCSISHVNRIFRSRSDSTINQYITRIRLEEAARLLIQTDLSVQEIAYMTGFSDSNYFSTCFRKQYHLCPRAYKKQRLSTGDVAKSLAAADIVE